jgi:hypothetical protein
MTKAAIAPKIHQPLYIHGDFLAEIPFHFMVFVDNFPDFRNLDFGEIVGTRVAINAAFGQNLLRGRSAYPVNVGQRYLYSLVFW